MPGSSQLIKHQKSLQTFYGLGPQGVARLLAKFSIHPTAKLGDVPTKTVTSITAELSNMTIENDLRRKLRDNIRRLRDMGTYRGRRHAMGLPVRGQNTRDQVRQDHLQIMTLALTVHRFLQRGSSTGSRGGDRQLFTIRDGINRR